MSKLNHVAFIMDGNRRWARKNKFQLIVGHNKGVETVEKLVEFAADKGITYMTFWAFSTENWNRAKEEVQDLMTVFRNMVNGDMIKRMMENGVRVQTIGDISAFPKDIYERLLEITMMSKTNKKITVTFALNYGGRDEILQAVKRIISNPSTPSASSGQVPLRTSKQFSEYLFTSKMPDPDLLVRTGGEQRLSGFMPWQTVYTELYFTETLWPDFDETQFQKALDDFASRERRFGK